jgi:hypothetical protein
MKYSFSAFALFLLAGLTASQPAAADPFFLNYQGLTDGSSSLNGTPITPGTSFLIQIGFDSSSVDNVGTGEDFYTPTSLQVEVGGTPFESLIPPDLYQLALVDATNTNFPGSYFALLEFEGEFAFFPGYGGTSTPGWSAGTPTPTVFTDYEGSLAGELAFLTPEGDLFVDYDPTVGVNSSLTAATPEGSSFAFMLIGMMGIGTRMALKRRHISSH